MLYNQSIWYIVPWPLDIRGKRGRPGWNAGLPANINRSNLNDRSQRLSRPRLLHRTTRPVAERLRDAITGKFTVEPGAFSDEPIGPHPISQFSVIFRTEEFQKIVPWLMLNREGLDVLVHPLTESSYDDHSKNALWLGTPVPKRLDILRPTYRAALLPAVRPTRPEAQ